MICAGPTVARDVDSREQDTVRAERECADGGEAEPAVTDESRRSRRPVDCVKGWSSGTVAAVHRSRRGIHGECGHLQYSQRTDNRSRAVRSVDLQQVAGISISSVKLAFGIDVVERAEVRELAAPSLIDGEGGARREKSANARCNGARETNTALQQATFQS